MRRAIVSYVPVVHQGFINLFEKYPDTDICIVSKVLATSLDSVLSTRLDRMLYAVDPQFNVDSLNANLHPRFAFLLEELKDLEQYAEIIMPEDDINSLIERKIRRIPIIKETTFLRYDWGAATAIKTVDPDTEVTSDILHQNFILRAKTVANRSADWWRQVGVVVVCEDGRLLTGFNEHMPHNQAVNVLGDPRSNFSAGELPDVCTAIHGEGSVIAFAASRKDISTMNADMYVTTFPCPVCARFIGRAGIKTIYYEEGYSRLDAKEILQSSGVRLVKVLFER